MKTNYKHSNRKIVPVKPIVKSNNHNFDKSIVVKWSSREDGRVVDMFCNVLKQKLKEVYV